MAPDPVFNYLEVYNNEIYILITTLPEFDIIQMMTTDFDAEHTAGVTGQQRMLTPSWHLFLPLTIRGPCLLCY